MKDLQNLVNNFRPPTEQQPQSGQKMVIDEFAKNIINQVFDTLATIFPAWKYNWKSDDPLNPDKLINDAKMQWTKAFNENGINTLDQIKYGFTKARQSDTDFLPSPGKFVSWCKPSPEDLGWPSAQKALKDCIAYKANEKLFFPIEMNPRALIIDLCKRVDWWLMNSGTTQAHVKKAEDHFESVYMGMINSGYREPDQTLEPRLPTEQTVKDNMSPEQKESKRARGLDEIRAIKAKMKRNELTL